MKISVLRFIAKVSVCTAAPVSAFSGTFNYSYQTVFDANADTYIVARQNVKKYSEWQNLPVTYWGPSANDTAASLTMRFDFPAPTARIYLGASLTVANWINGGRTDYGYASLWASTDGSSWQLLLDDQVPTGAGTIGKGATYSQTVPASLLGASEFWLQARMYEHDALVDTYPPAAEWADAQFSRYEPENPPASGKTFELEVTTVPEPGVLPLALTALLVLSWTTRKRG